MSAARIDPTLYTVRQIAEKYGVTRVTVWRWIRKGAVQVVRKGPRTGVRVIDAPVRQVTSSDIPVTTSPDHA